MKSTLKAQELIQVALFASLYFPYLLEMNDDKAKVLAAQVVNYLSGKDINRAIKISEEPLKAQIIAIKNIVEERAFFVMNNDKEVREMVVHYLRFKIQFAKAYEGYSDVLSSTEKYQVNDLLKRYEGSVNYIVDANEFLAVAQAFLDKRINTPYRKK
jgi:hypothetical protein